MSDVQDGGCGEVVPEMMPEEVREEMERRPYYGQLFVNGASLAVREPVQC